MSLFICFIPRSHASCEITSGTTSVSYTFSAGTTSSANADLTFSGSITCYYTNYIPIICDIFSCRTPKVSNYICTKAVFDGLTSSVSNVSLKYQLINLSVGGASRQTSIYSNSWYGPSGTLSSSNSIPFTVTLRIPTSASSIGVYPTGMYQGSFKLYWDMQDTSSGCEGSTASWDAGNTTLYYSFTMPSYCQLYTSSNVDFGTISDIGTTSQNYDSTGAINAMCNSGTPYTLYLSNGNNSLSGSRRMAKGTYYIPYQLYKTSSRDASSLWNETGGVSNVGGSGGLSLTGTGSPQMTAVYARIPQGTTLPGPTGDYSDTVIVTLTY